jgi:hypothetical protein
MDEYKRKVDSIRAPEALIAATLNRIHEEEAKQAATVPQQPVVVKPFKPRRKWAGFAAVAAAAAALVLVVGLNMIAPNQMKLTYGTVPDTIESLTRLPGVGRKTANLVVGDIFHKPAVVTDTHCIRICGKLGLTEGKDPYKVEMALWKILPHEKANDFCHRLVLFGRDVCTARSPKCEGCPLRDICLTGSGE